MVVEQKTIPYEKGVRGSVRNTLPKGYLRNRESLQEYITRLESYLKEAYGEQERQKKSSDANESSGTLEKILKAILGIGNSSSSIEDKDRTKSEVFSYSIEGRLAVYDIEQKDLDTLLNSHIFNEHLNNGLEGYKIRIKSYNVKNGDKNMTISSSMSIRRFKEA